MCHTSPPTSLLLHDILHVPKITKNLLSISQFTKDNDVIVEFNSEFCMIKDKKTRKVLLQGGLKNGLYQLDLSIARESSSPKFRALLVSNFGSGCSCANYVPVSLCSHCSVVKNSCIKHKTEALHVNKIKTAMPSVLLYMVLC